MRNPSRRHGFINIEIQLRIFLLGVGSALAIPPVIHWTRHDPVSVLGWMSFGIGLLMVLWGLLPQVFSAIGDWMGSFRKRPGA